MHVDDEAVVLTGSEGGVWRIVTQHSTHVMNLDRHTVIRHPGPGRGHSINDRIRSLRTINTCEVGRSGWWTMHSDNLITDFYWQQTTEIERIVRLSPAEQAAEDQEAAFQTAKVADGVLSVAEVGELLQLDPDGAVTAIEEYANGQLLGIERGSELWFPGFQFDREMQKVRPGIPSLLGMATECGWEPERLVLWLHLPARDFTQACPVEFVDNSEDLLAGLQAAVRKGD